MVLNFNNAEKTDTKEGNHGLKFTSNINDLEVLLTYTTDRHKELNIKTFYIIKRKSGITGDNVSSLSSTSETTNGKPLSSKESVSNKEQKVNEDKYSLDENSVVEMRTELNQAYKESDYNLSLDKEIDKTQLKYSLDDEYLKAIENGDMKTAQKLVNEAAEKAGYNADMSYKMQHQEPKKDTGTSLYDLRESDLLPKDYWDYPEWYTYSPEERDLFYEINKALNLQDKIKAEGRDVIRGIWVYRGVDKTKNAKENKLRNGDWVTPSYKYAQIEGLSNPNGYRIIEQFAKLTELYFDGNSIAELGFDDGNNYAYKDTTNNRKLLDVVTYDDEGNVIPLSKRFKYRNFDTRYSLANIEIDGVMNKAAKVDEKFSKLSKTDLDKRKLEFIKLMAGRQLLLEDNKGHEIIARIAHKEDMYINKRNELVNTLGKWTDPRIKNKKYAFTTLYIEDFVKAAKLKDENFEKGTHEMLDDEGWQHWESYLIDDQNLVYKGLINIGKSKNGNIIYDVNKIKKIGQASRPANELTSYNSLSQLNYTLIPNISQERFSLDVENAISKRKKLQNDIF